MYIHAGNPRMPPRVLAQTAGAKKNKQLQRKANWKKDSLQLFKLRMNLCSIRILFV